MTEILTKYFERHAEDSIERMKQAVLAVSYYERVRDRLEKNEDLSSELPIIKKLNPNEVKATVNEAIAEYKDQIKHSWDLPDRFAELGKVKIVQVINDREQLPRVNFEFTFSSDAGNVKVEIKSAGETYKVILDAGRNQMAAALAFTELEKQLAYISLTDRPSSSF